MEGVRAGTLICLCRKERYSSKEGILYHHIHGMVRARDELPVDSAGDAVHLLAALRVVSTLLGTVRPSIVLTSFSSASDEEGSV